MIVTAGKETNMWVSQLNDNELTSEIINRLLFDGIKDDGEKADCIIVLGSRRAMIDRVPKAVELYKAGRAHKIMLCGGITSTTPGRTVSEADHMSLKAIEMGVPEEDIIVENTSVNTIENILCSMLELQRAFMLNRITQVIVVTAPFHMRRSLAIARYFYPNHITVSPCPVNDCDFSKDRWQLSKYTADIVTAEAINLIKYVRNGVIPDFEI